MSMYSHFDCNINYCTVPGLWPSQSDLMCLHKVSDPYGIHLYLVEYQKIHCSAELNYCNIFGSWPSSWPGESARCSQSFPHHPFGWRVKISCLSFPAEAWDLSNDRWEYQATKDGDIHGYHISLHEWHNQDQRRSDQSNWGFDCQENLYCSPCWFILGAFLHHLNFVMRKSSLLTGARMCVTTLGYGLGNCNWVQTNLGQHLTHLDLGKQ